MGPAFIDKHINLRVRSLSNPTRTATPSHIEGNDPDNMSYVSLPYHEHLAKEIYTILRNIHLIPAWRSSFTTAGLFSRLKTPTPKGFLSNVVYQVTCTSCNPQTFYIGETCQFLKKRIGQHISDSKKVTDEKGSALSAHSRRTGHQINLDNTVVLHNEANLDRRRILETLYINNTERTLNFRTDFNNTTDTFGFIFNSN